MSDSDFGHATQQLPQMCHLSHTVCTATSREKMSLDRCWDKITTEDVTHYFPGKHTHNFPGKSWSTIRGEARLFVLDFVTAVSAAEEGEGERGRRTTVEALGERQ